MSYPVKKFSSAQTGAPSLTGQAGALDALLYAILVTGFNLKSVQGIARSGAVATATFASAHGYAEGDILLHAGADQAEYNGEVKIYNVTSTSYQFDVAGSPATPATGTITAKVAPAGWERVFTGTNKSVYRAATGEGIRHYLRVDDSNAQYATVLGYEAMTDVDTGTNRWPTSAQLASGYFWRKSSTSDATVRNWMAFADSKMFYALPQWLAGNAFYAFYGFGEINSNKLADLYSSVVFGSYSNGTASPGDGNTASLMYYFGWAIGNNCYANNNGIALHIARGENVANLSIPCVCFSHLVNSSSALNRPGLAGRYSAGGSVAYPDPISGGALVSPVWAGESLKMRGTLPGVYNPLHDNAFAQADIVNGISGLPGHEMVNVLVGGYHHPANAWGSGNLLFDATSWR